MLSQKEICDLLSGPSISYKQFCQVLTYCDRAQKNDRNSVRELLLNHSNTKDTAGNTLLHLAVKFGYVELSRLLIEIGFNVNALDAHQNTPLCVAIRENQRESAQLLRDHGAKQDAENNKRPEFFTTQRHHHSQHLPAVESFPDLMELDIKKTDAETLLKVLEKYPDLSHSAEKVKPQLLFKLIAICEFILNIDYDKYQKRLGELLPESFWEACTWEAERKETSAHHNLFIVKCLREGDVNFILFLRGLFLNEISEVVIHQILFGGIMEVTPRILFVAAAKYQKEAFIIKHIIPHIPPNEMNYVHESGRWASGVFSDTNYSCGCAVNYLIFAIQHDCFDVVEKLIERRADFNAKFTNETSPAFHFHNRSYTEETPFQFLVEKASEMIKWHMLEVTAQQIEQCRKLIERLVQERKVDLSMTLKTVRGAQMGCDPELPPWLDMSHPDKVTIVSHQDLYRQWQKSYQQWLEEKKYPTDTMLGPAATSSSESFRRPSP
ncbi:MAG: hypothetical protein A3I12_07700 [Gammaproteobacteria bacterium RIFCSPLOWO2_02_FULL_38_11]|nr:MAG: hypothetical protein A3I12_07700 [Gammaproteobacteria bacterium RIFCSPLOWO2_02_FULL_38_11]